MSCSDALKLRTLTHPLLRCCVRVTAVEAGGRQRSRRAAQEVSGAGVGTQAGEAARASWLCSWPAAAAAASLCMQELDECMRQLQAARAEGTAVAERLQACEKELSTVRGQAAEATAAREALVGEGERVKVRLCCRVVSSRVVSCRLVSSRVVSCRVVSCRVVSCRVVSCRVVSFRVVSCRVVSCHVL